MPSTFFSPVVGSAYYYRGRGRSRTVCRSTGYSLLQSIQATVLELLEEVGTLPSAGGAPIAPDQMRVIDGTNVAAGPGWDDLTLRGLYAFVQYSRANAWLPAIASDILHRGGPLSERTMKAAMWMLSSRGFDDAGVRTYGAGSPDDIAFDAGVVFPTYGEIPPLPANGTLQAGAGDCSPIAEGAVAGDPVSTTPSLAVNPWLVLALAVATVWGISESTKKDPPRKNPHERDPFDWWARTNPALRSGALANLQQDVMAELHRTGLWASGMRTRDTGGDLKLTGDTTRGKIGNVWRDTRIAKIARLHGFNVADSIDGWSLVFEPEGWEQRPRQGAI